MKANPKYKPDQVEALMFLREQKKSGFASDYSTLGTMMKIEYPALEDKEILKFLRAFAKEIGDIK